MNPLLRMQNILYSFVWIRLPQKGCLLRCHRVYQANRKDKWADKLESKFVKDDDGMYTHKANLKACIRSQTTAKAFTG